MAKHSATMLELAKKGAEHKYRELKAELAALVKIFPHLRYGAAVSPAMPDAVEEGGTRPPRRRARSKTAAPRGRRSRDG